MARELPSTDTANCLNCGTPLVGEFCHACGQRSSTALPTLLEFVTSGVAAVTDLDGRFWQSLRRLVVSPGALSVDFIEGRRASVLHPVQLFLTVAVAAALPAMFVRGNLELGGFVYIATAGVASAIGRQWAQLIALLIAAPVMAVALKALYWRRGRLLLEHLVVTTEFFALVLLVGTVETLVVLVAGGGSAQLYAGLASLGILLYSGGRMLRRVYQSTILEAAVGVAYLSACAATGVLFSLQLM